MNLTIANRQRTHKIKIRVLREITTVLLAELAGPAASLEINLVSPAQMAKVNQRFLQHEGPTDVITFEGDPAHGTAGEICVSADTAAAYAREHRRDFSAELILYLVHGWLHLAGYDDLQPAKKRVMRRAEARAVKLLQTAGVRPRFSLRH